MRDSTSRRNTQTQDNLLNNHNDLIGELGEWVDHSAKVDEKDADFDGDGKEAGGTTVLP